MKLHYDSHGTGPLVLLLHGFPESRHSWERQLAPLADAGFRAVAPDLRGYGLSPKPRGVASYRLTELVADVAELIDDLGGAPCVLVGHDWGAVIAWAVAMTRPDLVRRLVILNIPHPATLAHTLRHSVRQKLRLWYQVFFQLPLLPELSMRLFGRALLRRMGSFSENELERYAHEWRGSLTPMLNYYRALFRARGSLRSLTRPLHLPVLLLWSENEPVFLEPVHDGIGEWVPGLRVERIEGAGHFLQRDAPGTVTRALIDFARG